MPVLIIYYAIDGINGIYLLIKKTGRKNLPACLVGLLVDR
jgi:hypothetical protein